MSGSKLRSLVERLGGLIRTEQRSAGLDDQLQPVHQDVLHYLARCNRYSNTPAAVTEYLQITKGTASQSIRVLERRKFVLKRADKQDGRVVRLRLSLSGQRLVDKLRQRVSWQYLTDEIGSADLAAGELALTKILKHLQQHNKFRSFGQCNTCHHFCQQSPNKFKCGLTGEVLQLEETLQICREHMA